MVTGSMGEEWGGVSSPQPTRESGCLGVYTRPAPGRPARWQRYRRRQTMPTDDDDRRRQMTACKTTLAH